MKINKLLWMILGFITLALGTIGTALPMLPTVPFFMAAAVCFGKSSERLHTWFKSTKLYKDNLEDFVTKKAMTRKTKCRIMMTITLLMCIGLVTMGLKGIMTGCIVLSIIWVFHVVYFLFGVKTI